MSKRIGIGMLLALAALWCGVVIYEHALPQGQLYQGKYLSDWVRGLLSDRPEINAATESQIRQMGTNALPLLVLLQRYTHQSKYWNDKSELINWVNHSQSLFRLSNPDDRLGAKLWALCPPLKIRDVPLLIDLLADDDRGYAAGLLVSAGTNAGPYLVKALSHKNAMVRQRSLGVIEVVGYMDDSLLPALRTCLKDESEEIRVRVAIKLISLTFDNTSSVTVLSNAFNGSNKRYWRGMAHYVRVKFPGIATQAGLP